MPNNAWIIVKVGGSLFDLPDLRQRLRSRLGQLGAANVLLVPGGGATADAIRIFDATHQLGEEASHWLALQAMSLNARMLQELLPEARIVRDIPEPKAPARADAASLACASGSDENRARFFLLDAFPFFRADELRPDHLPHRWDVTSDSLAVRAATLAEAHELILLKSVAWETSDWSEAARSGIVDSYFARALQQAPAAPRVRLFNLRAWK
jgi:5-(aminomethyl)-3-furanmethanol phosphate kinase